MEEINQEKKEEVREDKTVMEIILTPEGAIKVKSSVLNNKVMCFGLLEVAKETIAKHHDQLNQSKIIKGNGGHKIMDFVRGGFR